MENFEVVFILFFGILVGFSISSVLDSNLDNIMQSNYCIDNSYACLDSYSTYVSNEHSTLVIIENDLSSFNYYQDDYIVGLKYFDMKTLNQSISMYLKPNIQNQMFLEHVDLNCVRDSNNDCRGLLTFNLTNSSIY